MKKTMRRFVAVLLTFMLITGVGVQSYGAETSVAKDNSVQATEEQQTPAKGEAKAEDTDVEKEAVTEATGATTEATETKGATEKAKMPAQDFSGSAGGINVSVNAPEGAFPEGTKMSLKGVSNAKAIEMLEGTVDGIVDAKGVDITFTHKGKEIEPEKKISVKLFGTNLEGDNFSIYHVADNGAVNKASSNASAKGGSFKAADFSVYIVTGTEIGTEDMVGKTITIKEGEKVKLHGTRGDLGYGNDRWTIKEAGSGIVEIVGSDSEQNVTFKGLKEGTANITYSYRTLNGTRNEKFSIKVEAVPPVPITNITVKAKDATKIYDGTPLKESGYEITEGALKEGDELFVKMYDDSQITDVRATTKANVIEICKVYRNNRDVSSEYKIKTLNGELKVNKRNVTLTSGSAEKKGDGTPLTNSDVTVGGDGFAPGEGATYNVTGSQLLPGKSANTFSYQIQGRSENNYAITKVEGTLLVVDPLARTVNVTAKSDTTPVYDGQPHDVTGILIDGKEGNTFKSLGITYTLTGLTATLVKTDAGTYAVKVEGTPTITRKNIIGRDVDVTTEFYVNRTDGTLKINPAPVTVKADDKTKVKGAADPAWTATVTGLVNGETEDLISYTIDRVQGEDVGHYNIIPTGVVDQGNYTVTYENGDFEIVEKAKMKLTVSDYSGKYDGQRHQPVATCDVTQGTTISYSTDGGQSWRTTAPAIRDAGKVTVDVKAENADYDTATAQYTLEVTPREITLKSGSDQKKFDFLPLYNTDVTIGGDGFVGNEGIRTYDFAYQVKPGSTDNTFDYSFKLNTNPVNYTVTKVEYGTLIVDNPDFGTIIVKGESKEYVYDGQPKEVISTKVDYEYIPSASKILGEIEKLAFYAATDVIGGSVSVPGLNAGDYDVTATPVSVRIKIAGTDITDCYKILYEKGTMKILPRPVTLTSATDSKMYDGTPLTNHNVTATYTGDSSKPAFVTHEVGLFQVKEGVSYDVTGTQTEVGSSKNEFTYTPNRVTNLNNYKITEVKGDLTVTPSDKLTVTGTSYDAAYDGQTHGDAAVPSVTNGTTVKYSTDNGVSWSTTVPTIKNVGTINVKVKAENSNYVTATTDYTLKVTPRGVTVRAMDAGKVYGDSDPADFVTKSTGTIVPDEVNFTVTREPGEDVGKYTITPSGAEVQGNYKVKYETGTFTITEKELTVTTASANKEYDGTPLTKTDGASITGFANNETATLTVTGTQTDVGTSTNTYKIDWDGTAKESNYKITENLGTLDVTPYTTEIKVTATGVTATYDGKAHRSEVKVENLPAGCYVDTATAGTSVTHVAEGSVITICDDLVIKDASGKVVFDSKDEEIIEDPGRPPEEEFVEMSAAGTSKIKAAASNPNALNVTFNTGTIKINPAPVKVTTDSATKTYDGTALKAKAHMKGLVNGETATVKATGSRTAVGSSKNTYKITWGTAQKSDYAVTDKLGTLTVNGAPAAAVPAAAVTPPDDPAGTAQATTTIEDGDTPLANVTVEDVCQILHFLLMLAALIVLIAYTSSMKRRQEEIFALKEEIAARKSRR